MVRVTFRLVNGKVEDRHVEQLPDRTTADLSEIADMIIDGFEKWMREKMGKKGGSEAELLGDVLHSGDNSVPVNCPAV